MHVCGSLLINTEAQECVGCPQNFPSIEEFELLSFLNLLFSHT